MLTKEPLLLQPHGAKRLEKPEVTTHTIYVLVDKSHCQIITDIATSLANKYNTVLLKQMAH